MAGATGSPRVNISSHLQWQHPLTGIIEPKGVSGALATPEKSPERATFSGTDPPGIETAAPMGVGSGGKGETERRDRSYTRHFATARWHKLSAVTTSANSPRDPGRKLGYLTAEPLREIFRERCWARATLVEACEIDLQTAVDELQEYAEKSGLIASIGQDQVQAYLAEAFGKVPRAGELEAAISELADALEAPRPRSGVASSTLMAAEYLLRERREAVSDLACQSYCCRAQNNQSIFESKAMKLEPWVDDAFDSFGDDEAPETLSNIKGNGKTNGKGNGAEKTSDNITTKSPALISRKASIITPKKVDWLWPGRLARTRQIPSCRV